MSWSASQCGSAHKKQLWTHRLVWLFLHIGRPRVWRRGWICTAPGVKPFKTCGVTQTYTNAHRNISKLGRSNRKQTSLIDSGGSSRWREGEWRWEMEFLCEWGEMMSFRYGVMAAQEIIFLGLLVGWLQLRFRGHAENELKAALVDDCEWLIFLTGGAMLSVT